MLRRRRSQRSPIQICFRDVGDNQNSIAYTVADYKSLEPLYVNMNFGVVLFIRYKKHLLIKVGYDYSNPFGIGGKGNIMYRDKSNRKAYAEQKIKKRTWVLPNETLVQNRM